MWLAAGPRSLICLRRGRLEAPDIAHPTGCRPAPVRLCSLYSPASLAHVGTARTLPRDITSKGHTLLLPHVGMTSLAAVAAWIVAGLAVVGAVALALLLSPELRSLPANWLEKHLFPDANQITPQMMAKHRDQSKVYRVLAFGDSLTEGFTQGGSAFHPYAKRVGDLLYPQLPKGWHLEIEEQGESGEHVLFGMPDRLQRTLEEHTTANRLYDWVLLLGGINDLAGDASTANEVLQGLDRLVQKCLSHGANVLLMTVMEVAQPEPSIEEQRQQLNKLIITYVQQRKWDQMSAATRDDKAQQQQDAGVGQVNNSNSSQIPRRPKPEVFLYDLAAALPYESLSDEKKFDFWDDGVHLSMLGYEHMGALITEALLPLVKQEFVKFRTAPSPAAATKTEMGVKKLN